MFMSCFGAISEAVSAEPCRRETSCFGASAIGAAADAVADLWWTYPLDRRRNGKRAVERASSVAPVGPQPRAFGATRAAVPVLPDGLHRRAGFGLWTTGTTQHRYPDIWFASAPTAVTAIAALIPVSTTVSIACVAATSRYCATLSPTALIHVRLGIS